jgi:hypothetical protein
MHGLGISDNRGQVGCTSVEMTWQSFRLVTLFAGDGTELQYCEDTKYLLWN